DEAELDRVGNLHEHNRQRTGLLMQRRQRRRGTGLPHGCAGMFAKTATWRKTVSPAPSMCSLNRMPGPDLARIISRVAFRPSSGSRRRSSSFNLIRSKAYKEYSLIVVAIANEIE